MPTINSDKAAFCALNDATPQDWMIIDRAEREYRCQYGPGHGLGLLTVMAPLERCVVLIKPDYILDKPILI